MSAVSVTFEPAPTLLVQFTPAGAAPITVEVAPQAVMTVHLNEYQPGAVTEDSTNDLSNKNLIDPKLTGAILDAAGLALLEAEGVASAVNWITAFNAAAGSGPGLAVAGTDTNADFNIFTAGSGVLKVNGGAVQMAATAVQTSGAQNVSGKTLLSTKISGALLDTNGNEALELTATASAVNHIKLVNGATGTGATVTVGGDDANADLHLGGRGTGGVKVGGNVVLTTATGVTPAGAQTLADKSLTSPKITGSVLDANGNEVITLVSVASAVNELNVSNAAAGNGVRLFPTGADGAVALLLESKGAAGVKADGSLIRTVGKETIWLPARAWEKRQTNGPADASQETTTNKVMITTLSFDAAVAEYAQCSMRLPDSWDGGTLIGQVCWKHGTASTNFGVAWYLRATSAGDGESLDSAWGTAQVMTDTGGAADTMYTTAKSAAITIGGSPAAGHVIKLEIYRDPAHASDTLAVDAGLWGVTVQYTTSKANDN
jgi:hypothetical protein